MKLLAQTFFVLSLLSSLMTSSAVLAGPEERMNNNCFEATKAVPNGVTNEICYEGLSVNIDKNILYTGATKYLPSSIANVELNKIREDYYRFTAETILVDIWESGCRDGLFAKVILSGKVSDEGIVIEDTVKIKIQTEVTNDTCHSQPQVDEIEFKRVNN